MRRHARPRTQGDRTVRLPRVGTDLTIPGLSFALLALFALTQPVPGKPDEAPTKKAAMLTREQASAYYVRLGLPRLLRPSIPTTSPLMCSQQGRCQGTGAPFTWPLWLLRLAFGRSMGTGCSVVCSAILPDLPEVQRGDPQGRFLNQHLTAKNLETEADYFTQPKPRLPSLSFCTLRGGPGFRLQTGRGSA